MRFLCCCCCRRRSVDERNDAEAVENARAADSDTDSFRQDSLDNFRFPENDHAKAGRSPSDLLPGARTANTAAGNKGDYFVPCYGPSPETALVHKDRGEWVPLVLGSPDSSDSPPIVARTVAASTAAAPVGAKTGTAPPPPPPPVSASESLPLSLKKTTTTTKKTATSEISSSSDANAKLASIAAAAASVAAAKSAARSAASVPQGNAKTATGAGAVISKTATAATASVPQGNAKATAGAAAAPKANVKATTSAAAASTNNGATAATLVPKGNAKATTGAAASATLPKTTAAPPKAAVSASAVSVPQKNNKVSPTEGAASKITKISTATAAKVSSSVADEAVCASLLTLINQLRISKDIKPLRLCDRLRPVALSAWKAREAAKDGLAVMPKCQTALKLKTGEVALFDCLSYLDIPLHSKEGLPAAAMHFWEHAGRYKTNSGQRPLKSESAFPAAGSAARRDLDACKEAFEALLLASRNTRVCLRLARTSRATEDESEPDRQPLAVVAVFAPEDAKP